MKRNPGLRLGARTWSLFVLNAGSNATCRTLLTSWRSATAKKLQLVYFSKVSASVLGRCVPQITVMAR